MNEQKVKAQGKGRPREDPNRKCFSFYCTAEEILYLRNLLKKIRLVLKTEVNSQSLE